jgi:citrate lyase subunit beta/citryl-CoA lyase
MIQTLDVFESDAIILDLEDSVDSSQKDAALELVHQFLDAFKLKDIELYVRTNDLNTTLVEEIKTLNKTAIAGYVIPKATNELIDEVITMTSKKIIALIETPRSVLNALKIADKEQVTGLILGAEDLSTALSIQRTKQGDEISFARSMIVYAAAAAQIEAIDTPFTDPLDEQGLRADSIKAHTFGFTSKTAIHPNQVDVINRTFVPSVEDIKQAKRIVIKADQTSKGAFSLDGKMIDKPIILRAKKTLELAKKYGLLEGEQDV